jgi:hypothetical protein
VFEQLLSVARLTAFGAVVTKDRARVAAVPGQSAVRQLAAPRVAKAPARHSVQQLIGVEPEALLQ